MIKLNTFRGQWFHLESLDKISETLKEGPSRIFWNTIFWNWKLEWWEVSLLCHHFVVLAAAVTTFPATVKHPCFALVAAENMSLTLVWLHDIITKPFYCPHSELALLAHHETKSEWGHCFLALALMLHYAAKINNGCLSSTRGTTSVASGRNRTGKLFVSVPTPSWRITGRGNVLYILKRVKMRLKLESSSFDCMSSGIELEHQSASMLC